MSGPRLYSIDPAQPFLRTLARALLAGELSASGAPPGDPLDLAATTIIMPTRRATRALQEAFLAVSPNKALLLPRIRPIAGDEDDLSLFADLSSLHDAAAAPLDLPVAVGAMERLLLLTRLVMQWSAAMRRTDEASPDAGLEPFASAGAASPAQAASLSRELARLIDMVETENVSLDGLSSLVEEAEFAQHWQKTLSFLEIITAWWPAQLRGAGKLSPMDRRNKAILAEANRLRTHPPAGPVIVAGVTGSIPATVELMRAVLDLANGALVLPGLDFELDEPSWQAITVSKRGPEPASRPHAEHPQFGLKTLLDRLGLGRVDVTPLAPPTPGGATHLRLKLISEAMRPSASTVAWRDVSRAAGTGAYAAALDGMSLIEAPSAETEAEAIALILREAAEQQGITAALVSPDRLLARRVAIRLEAWGIRVDDSAGRPFAKTVPGTVLDLCLSAVAEDFSPEALISLLKHPLVRLQLDPFSIRRAARAIELGAFRQAYLGAGLDDVLRALDAAERACDPDPEGPRGSGRPRAVRQLRPQDWQAARDLIARTKAAFAPLSGLFSSSEPVTLQALAEAHAHTAEALCAEPAKPGAKPASPAAPPPASPLYQGEAGRAAAALFDGLMTDDGAGLTLKARDYPDLYRALIATENVRPRVPVHPRLSIWGPLEARLQQPDIIILGSLNDGTWPESADPGPWLNRPMRQKLGLPAPEEKIGYAAHDVTQLIAGPRVVLTRAQKIDGVPTVPSRWLMRLKALLGGLGLTHALSQKPGAPAFLAWAEERDTPSAVRPPPLQRPAPRPPLDLRPRKLSVSGIETWIANPYAIFAGRILNLERLPPLGLEPDAAIRGGLIHEALARFVAAYPSELPADIEAELMVRAKAALGAWTGHARVAAFWLPRFERFARWFASTEPARRKAVTTIAAEIKGEMKLQAPGGPFTLTARADRIDTTHAGLVITDYKTGAPPPPKMVQTEKAPQLLLEAAIALAGGFDKIAASEIAGLRYIRASGGDPAGEEVAITHGEPRALAEKALAGLTRHIARFDDPNTPYTVTRRARFHYDFDAFAHLARVAEWSANSSDEDAA